MVVRNLVSWFEIPVTDMTRAKRFYETVFDVQLAFLPISEDMAAFPMDMKAPEASGMLEKGEHCVPSATGILIYFSMADIDRSWHALKPLAARRWCRRRISGSTASSPMSSTPKATVLGCIRRQRWADPSANR